MGAQRDCARTGDSKGRLFRHFGIQLLASRAAPFDDAYRHAPTVAEDNDTIKNVL